MQKRDCDLRNVSIYINNNLYDEPALLNKKIHTFYTAEY